MIVFLVFSMTFCWATNPCDFFVISGYGDDCEKVDSKVLLTTNSFEGRLQKSLRLRSTKESN